MIELELEGQSGTRVSAAAVLTVGRAWMNDLVLQDSPHVSGRHGQVEERDGALWFLDLGSRNGSSVLRAGGGEVECERGGAPVRIQPGDRLLLGGGDTPVVVRVASVDDPAPTSPEPGGAAVEPGGDDPRWADQRRIVLQQQEIEDLRRRLRRLDPASGTADDAPLLGEASKQAERVASYPTSVLITGPSGSGKGLVARTIHRLSERRDGPFLEVGCGTPARDVLERELFGHGEGAGADRTRIGLLEAADGGTLLLDEVDAIPPAIQADLLRFLQRGELTRVGETQAVRVDVRVLGATERDLEQDVVMGRFDGDLHGQLAVFPVCLAPLKDRPSDIPLLAQHFAERFGQRFGRGRLTLSEESLRALAAQAWPGNVTELRERIERAALLCRGRTIDVVHLGVGEDAGEFPTLKDARRQFTIEHVNHALELAGGVQREAARLLGVDPGNLSRLLRDLGLR